MTVLIRDSNGTVESPWGKLSVRPGGKDPAKLYRCWHGGQSVELTAEEQAAREAEESFVDPEQVKVDISGQAERRIEAGALVAGNLIRCDDRSVSRLHGMLKKAERLEAQSKPVSLKFKTKAGDTVIIDSAAAAGAVYDGISGHVAFILGRSADLQDQTPEQLAAFDPSLDAHWTE